MTYIYAFLFPALFAVIAQLLIEKVRIPVPVILRGGIILGTILGFFGIMGPIAEAGGFGVTTHLMALGEAVYSGVMGAIAGDPMGLVMILIIVTVTLGISGILGLVLKPKK